MVGQAESPGSAGPGALSLHLRGRLCTTARRQRGNPACRWRNTGSDDIVREYHAEKACAPFWHPSAASTRPASRTFWRGKQRAA